MIAILVLSPFVLVPIAAWVGSRWPRRAGLLALWPALLTVVFVGAMRSVIEAGPRIVSLPWAPSLGLTLSFNLDGLGLLFAILIAGIGALVVAYAGSYLGEHRHAGRFHAWLFAFMGAMLGVVLSDNAYALFVFWELTGFTSFLLIGFEHERDEARRAAVQALLVTGAGGLAFLAAAVVLHQGFGTPDLTALAASGEAIRAHSAYPAIALLVLLAAFTKSAQVPFHFWLPNAMAAPTPVSAYLHSATMVKAGVYLVARMAPVLGTTELWTWTLIVAGGVTMAAAAWRAVQETDLKRVLAYTTVSALGALMLMLGVGTREAIVAALVYVVAHAGYKGALFLVSGAIEHETGTRDLRELGGLRRAMPMTALAAALAAASMLGLPLSFGFIGKEALYESLLHAGTSWDAVLAAVAVGENVLLGMAALMVGLLPFAGSSRPGTHVHEAPATLWLPPLLLAAGGLVAGVAPFLLDSTIACAATDLVREPVAVNLKPWHGPTPVLALSGLTMALAITGYTMRDTVRRVAWPRSLGTERLYDATLAALEAAGRRIAPALQSASLRSYVMTIVLTAGVLVGTALVSGGSIRTFVVATDVHPHELLLVLFIVGGAFGAARATSSMTAVLSLGVVGYGVALMFLAFGAPDLAMTQFSVETLVVVIYVLVFRQYTAFGALSPATIRLRDTAVAIGLGALIAALVLFVGTSGVKSRLADYFVQAAPTLGHGRNVVNVILVDFRAFDTLGEITVLTTAAIGVAALLRIASEERRNP